MSWGDWQEFVSGAVALVAFAGMALLGYALFAVGLKIIHWLDEWMDR